MAWELTLRLATALAPSEVLDLLSTFPGLKVHADGLGSAGVPFIDTYVPALHTKNVTSEAFGFDPTVGVLFRLDKFDETERGIMTALGASQYLLEKTSAPAVLVDDGEHGLLAKIDESLVLNKDSSFWTPERLATIKQPYRLGEVKSPLL